MKLHETWTGSANPGDRTFSTASVEGVPFTVSLTTKPKERYVPYLGTIKARNRMYIRTQRYIITNPLGTW